MDVAGTDISAGRPSRPWQQPVPWPVTMLIVTLGVCGLTVLLARSFASEETNSRSGSRLQTAAAV